MNIVTDNTFFAKLSTNHPGVLRKFSVDEILAAESFGKLTSKNF
ncbi:MAG: hypothetical protein ACYTXC_21580 [Nostoc sp.]